MKKILLASGCSMTDKNYISGTDKEIDTSWPKWPELIAKKLDMDCINLGKCGAGNEYIYATLLEKILEKKDQIGLVMAGWSQCHRKDYQKWNKWQQARIDPNGDVFSWVKKSLRYMISLQLVCENYNIPYKQFQMINLYAGWVHGLYQIDGLIYKNRNNPDYKFQMKYPGDKDRDIFKLQKLLLDYEPYINVENFIGWPTIDNLGGYNIEQKCIKIQLKDVPELNALNLADEFKKDLIISQWDQHPNAKGQEKIAEFLYDRLG